MNLDTLLVMQDGVRNVSQLRDMVAYVRSGGDWHADSIHTYSSSRGLRTAPIIELARFPDGEVMIHDGHHRCIATYLANRHILYPHEFRLLDWRYEDYTQVNFDCKWVTPFDPRTHIRVADIGDYKGRVLELLKESKEAACQYIQEMSTSYLVSRNITVLPELARKYQSLITV